MARDWTNNKYGLNNNIMIKNLDFYTGLKAVNLY